MARLNEAVECGRSGLIALWGRRRVGKTRLLIEWCRKHGGLYTVADLSAQPVQRSYIAQAVDGRFPGFGDVEYPDWKALLDALSKEAKAASWRGPLVLDEFPYLMESCPSLDSQLQGWIDREARSGGLLTAIAGSSRHMMQGLTLDADAPLYGRAVEAMDLPPMSVTSMAQALGIKDPMDAVKAFSAWGGIPRYWELALPFGPDLDRAVDRLVLDPLGPLHLEPDRLLAQERPPVLSLRSILDAIGAGACRVSEIGGRLGQPATSLSRGLTRLSALGLITREKPFGAPERGGKRSLYRMRDPFFRLWFRVVAPYRALLAGAGKETRGAHWREHRKVLFAVTWEDLCREAVPHLGALIPGGPYGPASRYWKGSGPEWDVVASSLDGSSVLLGEVKWNERPATPAKVEGALRKLEGKGVPPLGRFSGTRAVHAVFTPQGPALKRDAGKARAVVTAGDVLGALSDSR